MSLGRASALLGAGTIVSRVTGLLRTIVLVAAIGSIGKASDAFAIANQLPNNVFAIIQTGLLTAVIIPQIVKASTAKDGGEAFISKLFTMGTVALVAVTGLATVCAPVLVSLYAPNFGPEQHALAVAFAFWCLPQIFFYGLFALVGETLNARRVFGPYAWAPIANNVISIAGFLVFIALFGGERSGLTGWDPTMIAVLAGSATLGIIIQAVVLLVAWRRTGLRLRPDFQWRGMGLNHIARLAGWTFLMVIVGQLAGLVQSMVITEASGAGSSSTVFMNAWLIFMLPYSIIVMSIGTPYFTQLSEHATAGRDDEVRSDIHRSIRTLGFFVVAALAAVVAAAVPASRVFTANTAQAVEASWVLLAFLVCLLPLAVLFIIQRTFYAYGDTRTPFFFTLFQGILVALTAVAALAMYHADIIPIEALTAAVALGQAIASLLQTVVAVWLLRRRIGDIYIRSWMTALLRFGIAAIPAGFAGWGVFLLLGGTEGWMMAGKFQGALGTCVIGAVTVVVYLLLLAVLRTPELTVATTLVRRFLPKR